MPINTFRIRFLSLVAVLVGSGVNQLFSLRYPGNHLVPLVAELIAYPVAAFLACVLPISRLNLDKHFNIKEHGLIVIASNVLFDLSASADATNLKLGGTDVRTQVPRWQVGIGCTMLPDVGIRLGWIGDSVLDSTSVHRMASQLIQNRTTHFDECSHQGASTVWLEYDSSTVLFLRLCRRFRVILFPRSNLYRPIVLSLGLLDLGSAGLPGVPNSMFDFLVLAQRVQATYLA